MLGLMMLCGTTAILQEDVYLIENQYSTLSVSIMKLSVIENKFNDRIGSSPQYEGN